MRTPFKSLLAAVTLTSTLTLTGCPTSEPCEIRPTHISASGECVEFDGELCDDDPCDTDDDAVKPKPVKSNPAAKSNPAVRPSRR